MKYKQRDKFRLGLLFFIVCLFFAVIVVRLVHFQIYLSPQYSDIVHKQSSGEVPIPASRGILYDRNGKVVANNVVMNSLYAYPKNASELKRVSAYIEKIFRLKPGTAISRYGLVKKRFRWIKRKLDDATAVKIARDAPSGLYLREETNRKYPFGLTGKQILGFTDIDHFGQSGIELAYDSILAGKQGWADIRRDGLRNTFRVKEKALVKPVAGQSLILTVDWRMQEILEEELAKGVVKHNAKSGMGVFLNCNTGEILAMAHYDPMEKGLQKPLKLRPVTDQFEPGSVFKPITVAGILDEGLVDFNDSVYCEKGRWKLGRRTLHDDKELEWLSFSQIMELSSNIGVAKYAIKQGGERFYQAVRRFGVGQKIGLNWPGETSGRLTRPSRWSDYNIASLAMGHAVAVSALQMAAWFSAIANGGELYQPRIVLGYVDQKANMIIKDTSKIINKVMNYASADTLRSILRRVVERGTAEAVNSSVVTIAGKTGTAQIPDLVNHRYFRSKFMASFAGFFPAEKPLFAGIVIMEEPQPVHYGGWTAGPVFKKIAERYVVLNPDLFAVPDRMLTEKSNKINNTLIVPDLVGRKLKHALGIAGACGIKLRCNDDSGIVIWQFPPADRLAFIENEVLVIIKSEIQDQIKMADLTGLSI
ncbi:MAG: peptidoglycan D,D-transpeptidase FtsI family protein, partial [Candidatus Zixiibacteriota bacterium]